MYALYQHRNGRVFGAVSFIICVYVFMGLSGIALYLFFEYRELHPVQIEPMIFLSLCLCIAFYGIFSYSDRRHRILIIENVALLRRLEAFQIITSVVAIAFFLPFALNALSGNVGENRWNLGQIEEQLGSHGLINTIMSLAGNLFFLSILLAFVNFSTLGRGGSARRAKILLVLSSVYVVYTSAYVSRDGFVSWVFLFTFLYLFFRDFMPGAGRRWVKRMALVIALPALIAFSVITMSRFSSQDSSVLAEDGSLLKWLLVYSGSQVFNFNDQYLIDAPPTMGLVYFKEVVKLADVATGAARQPLVNEDWWENYTAYGVEPWSFQTFVGSFVLDLTNWGALLLTMGIAVCTRASLRKQAKTGVFDFSNLLYFLLLSQIVLQGVFYYRQFSTFYAQIATILIAISFRLLRREGQVLVLEKGPATHSFAPGTVPPVMAPLWQNARYHRAK